MSLQQKQMALDSWIQNSILLSRAHTGCSRVFGAAQTQRPVLPVLSGLGVTVSAGSGSRSLLPCSLSNQNFSTKSENSVHLTTSFIVIDTTYPSISLTLSREFSSYHQPPLLWCPLQPESISLRQLGLLNLCCVHISTPRPNFFNLTRRAASVHSRQSLASCYSCDSCASLESIDNHRHRLSLNDIDIDFLVTCQKNPNDRIAA